MSTDPTIASDTHCFAVQPQTPQRQIRHRTSLEHVLSFTLLSPPTTPNQIAEATFLYHRILDDCQEAGIVLRKPAGDADHERTELRRQSTDRDPAADETCGLEPDESDQLSDYDEDDDQPSDGSVPLHKLFRAIYEHSPTADGQVNIVRIVLHGLFPVEDYENPSERALLRILPRARRWVSYAADEKDQVYRILAVFAADFLQGFFVPLKAQGRCTPSVSTLITPTTRTEVDSEQGTPHRLGDLRRLCLARDGGRCVLTRTFDSGYLKRLYDRSPRRRRRPMEAGGKTEAAHIIPHSLNALAGEATTLPPAKRMVWRILNMFSPGLSATLAGTLIDTPANALMLISELHDRFGKLECYLEAGTAPNSYTFHTVRGAIPLPAYATPPPGPIVFANNERAGTTLADLPSPRLLAIHRACCMMLSMSGAAEYVENLLDDTETLMQRGVLAEDGSSNFALLLKMRGVQEALGGEMEDWERPLLPVVMAK